MSSKEEEQASNLKGEGEKKTLAPLVPTPCALFLSPRRESRRENEREKSVWAPLGGRRRIEEGKEIHFVQRKEKKTSRL